MMCETGNGEDFTNPRVYTPRKSIVHFILFNFLCMSRSILIGAGREQQLVTTELYR